MLSKLGQTSQAAFAASSFSSWLARKINNFPIQCPSLIAIVASLVCCYDKTKWITSTCSAAPRHCGEGKHVCCLYLWRQSPERLTTPPAQHTHGGKSSIWISIVYQWSKVNLGFRLDRQLVACCVKCLGKSVKLQRIHSRYPVNCHHQPLSSISLRWDSSHLLIICSSVKSSP